MEFPAEGSPEALRLAFQRQYGGLAGRALALYGLSEGGPALPVDPLYGDALTQIGSDRFRGPAIVTGEWHSEAGNPTWEYEFARAIPPQPSVKHSVNWPMFLAT